MDIKELYQFDFVEEIDDNLKTIEIDIDFRYRNHKLRFKIRKFVINFLKEVQDFCNIFIYTHGVEPYAKEVVKKLNEEANINISMENVFFDRSENRDPNMILKKRLEM